MKAFHNDQSIKDKYVKRMEEHIKADELICGMGFKNSRGCAVGCTLNKYEHKQYEIELGVPQWLARLEDSIFENMNVQKSKSFPLEFLNAVPLGVDLNKILKPFLIYVLEDTLKTFDHDTFKDVKDSIDHVIHLLKKENVTEKEWDNAAADADADAAADAAEAAAGAAIAAKAAAWGDTEAAAWAARDARAAARAATGADAANCVNCAAWAAEAAKSTRATFFNNLAEKLLELIKGVK